MIKNTLLRLMVWTLAALLSLAPSFAQIGSLPGMFQIPANLVSTSGALYCTGGTITTSGVNRIHTFTSGGTLTCTGKGTATWLVVGGGGGGGSSVGGGGGAGGYQTGSGTLSTGAYTVTVGGGGNGGSAGAPNAGSGGSSSVFNSLTSVGGGGGGASTNPGVNGGSGGGGGAGSGGTTGGTGTAGQGNNGGTATTSGTFPVGGGGGAGSVGANGAAGQSGAGGSGTTASAALGGGTYAGGGGGGGRTDTGGLAQGAGGTGGGGAGGATGAGTAGTANTGGGGGGGGFNGSTSVVGGAGGSGVVIVSYTSSPISLGTNSATATGSTIALTAGANIVAGDTVVVSVGHLTLSGTTVTGVSDGTNTYTLATSGTDGALQEAELWYCVNCLAVTSPVITATFSATAASRVIGAARLPGGVRALDVAPAGVGTTASSSPTVTTGTLNFAGEIIFGFLFVNTNPTVTEGSGFTNIYNENASVVTNHLAYQVVTATTSVAYSPTTSTANNNVIMVAGFH